MIKKAIEAFQNGLDVFFDERWFPLYGTRLCIAALLIAKYWRWLHVAAGIGRLAGDSQFGIQAQHSCGTTKRSANSNAFNSESA